MENRDDELLTEIPDVPVGGFAGYRDGNRIRRSIIAAVVVATVAATMAGVWWARRQEAIYRGGPGGEYQVSPAATAELTRPEEMVWSGGRARLGLSRGDPGVHAIRLPDRVIRLADGFDHAQIKVDVRQGKTHRMDVIVGDVEVELLDEAAK